MDVNAFRREYLILYSNDMLKHKSTALCCQ